MSKQVPAVLKFVVQHLVTFFIMDGGKTMNFDMLPRQLIAALHSLHE